MSKFGFGPPDDGSNNNDQNNNSENFDFNEMMRQLQSEIQKMMPNMPAEHAGALGFFNSAVSAQGLQSQGALPKEVIREVAKRFIQTHGTQPIGANDQSKCLEAFSIANIWLDQATVFPQVNIDHPAISPLDWLNITIDGWHSTFEPLAIGLTNAISKLIDEASAEMNANGQVPSQIGAMSQILRSFIGHMLATQMGNTIGALASASKGAHDAALPITSSAKPSLLPQNLRKFGEDLQIPETEIAIYFALREAATVRLFESNPWLVSYMKAAIAEYGRGIHIDIEAIQRQAEEMIRNMEESGEQFDPQNGESFTIALNNGLFTPDETPQQSAALEKLETSLALIDGWVDEVIRLAAGSRLPAISSLSELLRRERVSNSPIQQLFKALFNLEVSPRNVREATNFWSEIRALKGLDVRDRVWSGLLPTKKDLADPGAFIAATEIPDDLSGLLE